MTKRRHSSHAKRHGRHHKRSKRYTKVYAPYLPLFVGIVISVLVSFIQPASGNVLPYATNMSHGGLQSSTNSHRASAGVGSLAINAKLNSAAQAKANDMVNDNYWSHNTPGGDPPWVFIDAAGYSYARAGENLAYGFLTSSDTVQGWMNSPTHKANMLDGGYIHVGFGFANSSNFVGDGQQTVVVAMYGTPLGAQTQTPSPPPAPKSQPESSPQPIQSDNQEQPQVAQQEPKENPANEKEQDEKETEEPPVTATSETPTNKPTDQPEPEEIQRASLIGYPQALGALTIVLAGLVLFRILHFSLKLKKFLKHHPKLKKAIRKGEHLVLHHPLLDSTILGLTILGWALSRVVGVIL